MTECEICPHQCKLSDGQRGFCGARVNSGGRIVSLTYGKVTALALDPIEKKPLRRFSPGSMILSVGQSGCNMRCPFCQNHHISAHDTAADTRELAPKGLVDLAENLRARGNIGLAFTYNEPLVGYEYVLDCASLAHKSGLKNVLVTNGVINTTPLESLLPHIDAMNIDLKGFTGEVCKELGGSLDAVKNTIELAHTRCHVEITTLVVPGLNDSPDDMERQCEWLAGLNPGIPLHLSRFFPNHRFSDRPPTPRETLYSLQDIASRHLKHVYLGNM